MWPKMLMELLPHLSRLVPMWDNFLSSKAANEKATETALATIVAASDGMRQSVGEVAAAHATLYRQIQQQGAETKEQIAALEQEMQYARIVTERLEAAVRQIEARVSSQTVWLRGGVLATVLLLAAILVMELMHRSA